MGTSRKYLKKRRKHIKSLRKKRGGSKPTIVIFDLNSNAGFFSQFWFMCKAYIYAKKSNFPFFINSSSWNYKSKDGWHDYFISLNEYKDDGITKDIQHFSHYNDSGIPKNYTIMEYIEVLQEIYKPNEYIHGKIKEYVDQHKPYNSIYIRRGDKGAETPMNPIDEILGFTDLKGTTKKLFVQTDDYSVIGELQKLLPSVEMITLTQEKKLGAHFGNILQIDNEKRKEETENLLISIGIFLQGEKCWTDIRSNIGRFHKFADFTKVKYYPDNMDVDTNRETMPAYDIYIRSLYE
jgi:hypothetical protein